MTAKGGLVVNIERYWNIKTITIQHDNVPIYAYDPAIEVYDLSGITGNASFAQGTPGYKLNGGEAHYLANPSGYPLNNRLAVSQTDFIWGNGLKTNLANNQWRILAVNGLKAGDRVVITYSGTTMEFGSNSNDYVFAAAGDVFKDENKNGDRDDEESYIKGGDYVVSGMTYTMERDNHLDIRVPGAATITKIEIYSDHKATMEDRYNGLLATGYTAYFTSTGQLIAKEHVLNGGLEIHIGNDDNTQHAEVVLSDMGPVSYVYDQEHYKMARQQNGNPNITNAAPYSGTFYKFMPDVDGTMTVRFKAYNIKYQNYRNGNGKSEGNEIIVPAGTTTGTIIENNNNVVKYDCPYYLMALTEDNGNYTFGRYTHPNGNTEWAHTHQTGDVGRFENIKVKAGNTYYVYGWWRDPEHWETASACGVAELIDVTFVPDNIVIPLAKWVSSNTTSDNDLATLSEGTTVESLHIKKMSDNIQSCTVGLREATVEGQAVKKLTIGDITYKSGAKKGGTILIKVGDPKNDDDPVFAYTIAYDASEGHTWNFSENSLSGLDWSNWKTWWNNGNPASGTSEPQAIVKDFKTANDNTGLLYQEMHENRPDGTVHTDWTFDYRITKSATEQLDPMYLNKYPMEGNNADMMWDTEGLIINTDANKSCIYNEYVSTLANNAADHSSKINPDRYVGILPGGSFTIPQLDAGDRVVIRMGSGNGSGNDACKFNITGALDAIGQEISSSDIYNAGGSQWDVSGGVYDYRGAYQFISRGGDMTFTMNGGSMTKLYAISIYHGTKSGTTDATRVKSQTYNDETYDANAWWLINDYRTETPARAAYSLHFRGKGQRQKTPVVLYKSGNINTDDNLIYAELGATSAPFILFKSEKEQYGMFRMRIEDYELNNKYVADYGLQNVAVGYLEKKEYPYTWDFTDLMGYVNTSTRIQKERTNLASYVPQTVTGNYDIEFMNNTVGENVKSVEQWKEYVRNGDIPPGYGLHLRNEPYNGGVMWGGGQLYAGDEPFGETLGLSISAPGVNETYNGGLRITEDGLCLTGGNWGITIPEVGSDAAIYVRAKPIGDITAGVGDAETAFTYVETATDGTGDMIYAVSGTGGDMNLIFNNLVIKKIAVASDAKTVNKYGWNTESREHPIDPSLLPYMTGKDFRTYIVTDADKENNTVTLARIDGGNAVGDNTAANMKLIVPGATKVENEVTVPDNSSINACIIRYVDDTVAEDAKEVNLFGDGSGFHLFVPDMHDAASTIPSTNLLKARVTATTDNDKVARDETVESKTFNNYAFTYQYRKVDDNGNPYTDQKEGVQAFYRIVSGGARSGAHKAYLSIEAPASSRASSRAAASSQSAEHYDILFQEWDNIEQMKGDVNGDGRFNKLDVNTMADYVAGRPAGIFKGLADMNDDGNIDIVDMTLMIKKITGE